MQSAIWRIDLLGGLRASRGNQIVTRFDTRKTAALLAYLACARGTALDRCYIRREALSRLPTATYHFSCPTINDATWGSAYYADFIRSWSRRRMRRSSSVALRRTAPECFPITPIARYSTAGLSGGEN